MRSQRGGLISGSTLLSARPRISHAGRRAVSDFPVLDSPPVAPIPGPQGPDHRCARCCSTSPVAAAGGEARRPAPGPGRGPRSRARLRRLPHRPPRRRRRAPRSEAAARPRPPGRRHGRRGRATARTASRSASASASRGSAGPAATCRYCRRGRENLCDRAPLHRLSTATAATPSSSSPTSATASRCPTAYARRPGGAAALRRADRLPRAAAWRATPSASASTASAPRPTSSARSRVHEGRRVFAFTRPGDDAGQAFARELGAEWAGALGEAPPEPLDAAIVFAPGRRAGADGAARGRAGRHAWSAPAST